MLVKLSNVDVVLIEDLKKLTGEKTASKAVMKVIKEARETRFQLDIKDKKIIELDSKLREKEVLVWNVKKAIETIKAI